MPSPTIGEADFIALFEEHGAAKTAAILGLSERRIYERRVSIEGRIGRKLTCSTGHFTTRFRIEHPGRLNFDIESGVVLIASDCHYWPGIISTAHRAFVKACKEFRPKVVIMNGDVLDGATISRHPPINWEQRPKLADEIKACQDRLGEITVAADKAARFWTLGNHDSRLETRIATLAPEFAKVHGVHLKDHFVDYEPCWSVWINDQIVVKHRVKGGVHATHNNTLWAGKTLVTGHLHSLKVTPFSDYNGTRWGVDTGTLADPSGPQFTYTEDNPLNHRSGFAVLTIDRGELRWPELVHVVRDGEVEFRGRVWSV